VRQNSVGFVGWKCHLRPWWPIDGLELVLAVRVLAIRDAFDQRYESFNGLACHRRLL
jgi:hypothetical protein